MMYILSNCAELFSILENQNYRIIGIDGMDGAGKSFIANKVATKFDLRHINLDDYVEKNKGQYAPNIKYDLLRRAIEQSQKPIIIDGVCLLAILNNMSIEPDLLLYVKRMSSYGIWHDGDRCEVPEDIDAFISREKESLRSFAKLEARLEGIMTNCEEVKYPELSEELIRYHYNFKPHDKASIIYENIVDDQING